jgi:hypothetical protein
VSGSQSPEFLFALRLSDEPYFERMLADLAAAVLAHVGFDGSAIDELGAVLRSALADGASKGSSRCEVRFRAHSGQLHIVVAYPDGAEWQTTRPLP